LKHSKLIPTILSTVSVNNKTERSRTIISVTFRYSHCTSGTQAHPTYHRSVLHDGVLLLRPLP